MNFFSLFKRKLIYSLRKKINIDIDNFEEKSLDALFHHYGSDKANVFKINNSTGHGFSKFYDKYFNQIKNKNINILEIGSYAGASAAAFVKFLPNTKVYCFDINISNYKYASKNIEVYGIDVNNEKKVEKLLNKIFLKKNFKGFDCIIDDGSHNLSDILFSLNFFFKHLKSRGFYIIEDYKHPNYYSYNKNINHILIDELLVKFKNKEYFSSDYITSEEQNSLFNSIKEISTYKGNLKDSDICFIEKN